jgi:hypothetical protein
LCQADLLSGKELPGEKAGHIDGRHQPRKPQNARSGVVDNRKSRPESTVPFGVQRSAFDVTLQAKAADTGAYSVSGGPFSIPKPADRVFFAREHWVLP